MRAIDGWLQEYGRNHCHRVNRAIHKVLVPTIAFSVLGFFYSIPVPGVHGPTILSNWAWPLVSVISIYYFHLSKTLAFGMLFWLSLMIGLCSEWDQLFSVPLGWSSLGIFTLSWLGQFLGHRLEGHRPSFLQDLRFLLIGPLWVLHSIYERFGWRA